MIQKFSDTQAEGESECSLTVMSSGLELFTQHRRAQALCAVTTERFTLKTKEDDKALDVDPKEIDTTLLQPGLQIVHRSVLRVISQSFHATQILVQEIRT